MSRSNQPRNERMRGRARGEIEIPVGLEQVLYRAAQDDDFRTALTSDAECALVEAGYELRPSESAALAAISSETLAAMIDRIAPENPKRRKFMGLVAASAASLAAGTVLINCDDGTAPKDSPDAGMLGDTDVDMDTDTDSDTDTEDGGMDAGDEDAGDEDAGDIDAGDDDTDEWDPDSGMDGGE